MRPSDSYMLLRQKQRNLLWRERVINETSAREIQAKVNIIDAESRRQQRYMDYQKKLFEYEMGDRRSSGSFCQSDQGSASSSSSSSSDSSTPPPDSPCCKIHALSSHCCFYPCQEISNYHSIRDVSKAALAKMGTECFVENDKPRPLTTAQLRERGLRHMTNELRKRRYGKRTPREWITNYGDPRNHVNINKVTYTASYHH